MENYFEKLVAYYEYPGLTFKFEPKVEITLQNFEEQRTEILQSLQSMLPKIMLITFILRNFKRLFER